MSMDCLTEDMLPRGRAMVQHARNFLNGHFPASTYFKDFPEYAKLFPPGGVDDYIWSYNEINDKWKTEPYRPSEGQRLLDKVKGMIGTVRKYR